VRAIKGVFDTHPEGAPEMKRLALIAAGVIVAGGVAATPAVAGLAGNPSFSHEIPVPPPSAAKTPLFADDHARDGATAPASAIARPADDHGGITRPAEPGDDQGGLAPHAEPGDDHGGLNPQAEPGDDHGGLAPHAEPTDDHGGLTPHAEPGDDHGGSHGGSGDDSGGSRGGRG
jgi:hypothetical protein